MEVILLENTPNVGKLGDIVRVKDGFGRNYLLPRKMARKATAAAIKEFEVRRAELEKLAAEKLATAQAAGEKLASMQVQLSQKAGVDGRLFGSVTNGDIAVLLKSQGIAVEKQQVRLPAGPLKTIGEHPVQVLLHSDVVVDINVTVIGETV